MPRHFTQQGLERLRKIIAEKESQKISIGREVGEAAGDNCDWHDNAPYEDARERLELVAADIRRFRDSIHDVVIITIEEQNERVAIGTTVKIETDGKEEKVYTIGAAEELNSSAGLITYESPIAKAIIGKKVGDSGEFSIGGKETIVTIKEILPPSTRYYRLTEEFYKKSKS